MLTKNSLEDVTNARRFCNIKMEPKESNDNKKQLKVKRQNNMRMTRVGRLLIQAAIVTLVWKFVWNVDSIVLFIINLIISLLSEKNLSASLVVAATVWN